VNPPTPPRLASLPSPLVEIVRRGKPRSPRMYAVARAWVDGPDVGVLVRANGYGTDEWAAAADALGKLSMWTTPDALAVYGRGLPWDEAVAEAAGGTQEVTR
jgi:hypothetical protein